MYKSIGEIGVVENKNQDQYAVLELVNDDQKKQLLNSHKVVLVDVFADWCGPCKQIAPSYALLAMKYAKPTICAVVKQQYDNVEDEIKDKIQGIPLFLFYEYGKLVDMTAGGDLADVEKRLEALLSRVISESNLTKEQRQDVSIGQVPPQYKSNIRSSKGNMPDFENYKPVYQVDTQPRLNPSMHNMMMPSQSVGKDARDSFMPSQQQRAPYPQMQNQYPQPNQQMQNQYPQNQYPQPNQQMQNQYPQNQPNQQMMNQFNNQPRQSANQNNSNYPNYSVKYN